MRLLALVLLACLALAACHRRDERPRTPLAPPEPSTQAPAPPVPPAPPKNTAVLTGKTTDERPKTLIGNIRGRAARLERINELKQIGLFYATLERPPQTAEQLMDATKRDAPAIYQAMKEGYYVVNPMALKRRVSGAGIIAYEVEPDTNGQYVVRGDGSVDAIPPHDLQAALAK